MITFYFLKTFLKTFKHVITQTTRIFNALLNSVATSLWWFETGVHSQ